MVIAFQRADLFDQVGVNLGRVAAGPQQREHQRCEFVAHRQAGEPHPLFRIARTADDEAGLARIAPVEAGGDEIVERGNLLDQLARLARLLAVVQRGDQFHAFAKIAEIGLELGLHGCIEHGSPPGADNRARRVEFFGWVTRDRMALPR